MKGKETNKFHSSARTGKPLEKYFGKKFMQDTEAVQAKDPALISALIALFIGPFVHFITL